MEDDTENPEDKPLESSEDLNKTSENSPGIIKDISEIPPYKYDYLDRRKKKKERKDHEVKKEIHLTDEQKLKILDEWNSRLDEPPGIKELTRLIFPEIPDDARSMEHRAIRDFLASKEIDVRLFDPDKNYEEKLNRLNEKLTEENREYIRNHIGKEKPYQMARVLWNNPTIGFADYRTRLVSDYVRFIEKKVLLKNVDDPDAPYRPPKSLDACITRINKYVKGAKLDAAKLEPRNKKNSEALIKYLHNNHFLHQMNLYTDYNDRVFFESSLIETIWNKPDLEIEDIQQYIILATEKVMSSSIQKTIVLLQEEQDRNLLEDNRLSMALVTAVSKAREEYTASIKRQQSLYEALTEKRSKRLSEQMKEHASVLNLITAWKNYESRQKLLKLAQEKKQSLRKEIEEIENLDEMKIRLLGLSVDEILNG